MRKLSVVKSFGLVVVFLGLAACDGGGGGSEGDIATTTPTTSSRSVSGGGVKGPLANAIVTAYAFDPTKADFKGLVAGSGSTSASAAIVGLALPFPVTPPYILEFTSDAGTTDITTGAAPVITTMRTVITQSLLDSGEQIYATPLTTMAVDIAIANSNPATTTDQFKTALAAAAAQVVSTLGFGMDSSIDIFDTPPLVDDTTNSTAQQAAVAAYRTAVEAVTAIAFQINQQSTGGNTDSVLAELSADLADGGGIDGSAGTQINANTLQVFEQDPATLPIPRSGGPGGAQTVGDVQAILVAETATTGTTTLTTELDAGGSITTAAQPAETNPDSDGDGTLNVNDAFPEDPTEQVDSDGDGIGDNADPDDNNNGILDVDEALTPTPVANDADQDGFADSADNCPAIFNPSQNDLDGDEVPGTGGGDACDDDIDGDTVLNGADAFPLNAGETVDTDADGVGNNTDADDDNDGVADPEGGLVAPAGAPSAGVLCSLLRDCDGDGVFDGSDFDPIDPDVTSNFAPVANDDTATVDEDTATFSIAVTANDTDNDGNPGDVVTLSAIGSNDAALGSAVINGNSIDYTPVADASGTDTFTYTVTDGTVTAAGSVTVTVNAVNDAPVAADDSAATNEDIPVTTADVLANDSDAENDSLSVAAGNPTAAFGTVANNGDGTFTYTPNANINGSDSFEYTVLDGNGGSDVGTVNITIGSINDAPDAVDDSLTVNEDTSGTTADVRLNDSDTEGDSLSVSDFDAISANGGSVADAGNGTYTYTPAANFNGADSFTYTLSDGNGGSDVATVNVTVNAVNDDPVANDDAANTDEDVPVTTVNVLTNDTDAEGDTLALAAGNPTATLGTVVNNGDGTFTYTPNANVSGADSFDYSVLDGNGGSDVGTVDVVIGAINDAPDAVDDSLTVNEDTSGTTADVRLNDSDTEGDSLSVSDFDAISANGGSVADAGNGTYTYTPAANFNGADSFTYTLSDGNGGSDVATVNVTVNAINDDPVGNADAASAAVLAATVVDVLANDSDVDGDTLTVTGVTQGSAGSTVAISGGGSTVTFTDVNNVGATETFTYDLFDGTTTVSGILVTMTVTVNAPPVANADSATTDEDTPVTTGDVLSNDSDGGDGNALSITAFDATSANGGSVVNNGDGTFGYTPDANFNGDDTFTYTISDTFSNAIGTVTVTVNAVNDDPVANADSDSTDEDTPFTTLNVLSNDNDGGDGPAALSVTASDATSANGGSVVDNSDGTFGYTPAADFNGEDTFSYTVSDGSSTAVATVTITVNPVNDAPVAVDDTVAAEQNTLVIIDVLSNDTDVENDTLSVALGDPVDAANGIATNNNDGSFDYVPDLDYIGTDSFTYTVTDGNGGSAVGTVNITVNPPGNVATVADLLDEIQGGGVGALESYGNPLPEFEYWRDTYNATTQTLSFIDAEYDYDSEMFVDISGFDSYWLTSIGTWELPSGVIAVTPTDVDGSMVVAIRDAGDTENVASFRIRALTQDIAGNLMSDYLDASWAAQLQNASATFGAGAQLVTSYSFEALADAYSFELEDWCEFDNPARYAALNNSCNGVYINSTDSYATSLAELQVATAWTDTDTTDDSLLDTVSLSFDEANNAELLAELVVAGNVVNFYVRDYDETGVNYVVKQAETSSWSLDSVSGVMMIRFTIPAALQSQFPDLGDEGGLNPFFTEFGDFVRGGSLEQTGSTVTDTNILNGIALDEVLANFDAPTAPDVTELIGTWVSDVTSSTNGDPTVFHYFASTNYEVSGTCDNDGSIGLEYGTMIVNAADGTFSTDTSVNGRGSCSLANVAGPGTTLAVNGDTLTLDVSGQITTFSRLKGDLSPLVGSWLAGDIAVGGDGGHVLLTFFSDGNYMHSEDCSVDGIGTEYGPYSWDEGGTNQVTTSQVYDGNGGIPGCGFSENVSGDWELAVTGDTLTVTVPGDGSFDFTRISPTLVPITPPIAFVEGNLPNTTAYNVEYDADTDSWLVFQVAFGNAGEFDVTPLPAGSTDFGSYEVINGVLETTDSGGGVGYAMIMSLDASGAQRLCLADTYGELNGCAQPGETFLFDNQTDADNFVTAREAGATFSGPAVDASTVFGASAISMLELDSYYDGELDAEVDELLYFELTADGTGTPGLSATDDEFVLVDGSWVASTDYFDIALTSTGWKANVDWRFDTSTFSGSNVTLSNVEAGETLQSLTATFSEMALVGEPIFDYIDSAIAVNLVNGTFGTGAKIYETTVTFNTDYYYINDWGTDCDDGFGGNYNGNCNVAQLRTLDRVTGDLTGFDAAADTSFIGDNTATIELGWRPDGSLLGVFLGDGTLEFWEVDWSSGSSATYSSGNDGTWTSSVVKTETLIEYVVPAALQNSYQVQGGDSPAVFLSQQNGYMRFGELEDAAGPLGEPVYFFNRTALEDINANIPGTPTLP